MLVTTGEAVAAQAPPALDWAGAFGGVGFDEGQDLALDGAGNVYTTGPFAGTVDFDPGPGTFNLTSAGATDIFVSKLDTAGNLAWAVSFGGTGADLGFALATDTAGNVYTTGYFAGTVDFDPGPGTFNLTSAGSADIFVTKLDGAGNFGWAASFGGALLDEGHGIVVDGTGNVYTTGFFEGTADFDPGPGTVDLVSNGARDIFVSKLDGSGSFGWAVSFGSPDSDEANAVAIDGTGGVYTTGYFRATADFDPGPGTFDLTSAGADDAWLSKLDAAGNFAWAVAIGDTDFDVGHGVAVDGAGNVVAGGLFRGTVDFDPGPGTFNLTSNGDWDAFVTKLDGAGTFAWAATAGGPTDDDALVVEADAAGNVYATGFFTGTADFDPGPGTFNLTANGGWDAFVWKLDPAGELAWAVGFGGPDFDVGLGVPADAAGNVYATGGFRGTVDFDPGPGTTNLTSTGGSSDVFVMKLDVAFCNGLPATIVGTDGADVINGTSGDDVVVAKGGNDTIRTRDGNDTVCAGDGDDTIRPGAGDDTIFGEAGSDTVDYRTSPAGVDVNLAAGTATGDGTDTLDSIENLFGSQFDDVLRGDDRRNVIAGARGDDSLQGRGGDDDLFGNLGNDLLNGRDGDDLLDGGAGTDQATYIQAPGPVTVDLRIGGPQPTGDGTDTLVGIADLTGSDFADTLIGNAQANTIFGGMGDDTLEGRSGDDTLRGNQGTDTARGGPGTDSCTAEVTIGCP